MTEALRAHIERRLRFALSCCVHHIQRIVLRLSDINGPRGGKDKHCRIQVVLAGMPDIVIEATEADLYVTIERAADRTGQTVVRKTDRQKTLLKQRSSLVLDNKPLI